ncbi:MAG: hypothetical protein V4629_13085 [Pseudomonadota bacterium]
MNKLAQKMLNTALNQFDKVGYALASKGITYRMNRHTLIASAMVQKSRIEGEMDRLQLHVARQKKTLDSLLSYVPVVGKKIAAKKQHS